MKNNFMERLSKFLYFGYSKKTVFCEFESELNESNLLSLRTVTAVISAALFLSLIYLSIFEDRYLKLVVIAMALICVVALFLVTHHLLKNRKNVKPRTVVIVIVLLLVVSYATCAFLGIYNSQTQLCVMLPVIFGILPATFFLLPHVTFLISFPLLIGFIAADYYFKERGIFIYDVLDCLLAFALGMAISVPKMKNKLTGIDAARKLYLLSVTDTLTGLMNRAIVFEKGEELLKQCSEKNKLFCCIVLDIDNFKKYNDTYGHPQGDVLLAHFGRVLETFSKENNLQVGRIGGEEFLFIADFDDEASADRLSLVLLETVRKSLSVYGNNVSASLGLFVGATGGKSLIDIYICADNGLYAAKSSGKDCCCKYNETTADYFVLKP